MSNETKSHFVRNELTFWGRIFYKGENAKKLIEGFYLGDILWFDYEAGNINADEMWFVVKQIEENDEVLGRNVGLAIYNKRSEKEGIR